MFAPFYDLTLMHHTDLICVTDRRETVGDHYGRTVLHQVLQRFLYQTFGFRIQGGCGLIQDQDRGILQDRTGDTDSLALSTRQFSTSVTYIGPIPVGALAPAPETMKLYENGAYLVNGRDVVINSPEAASAVQAKTGKTVTPEDAKKQTIAYGILKSHNTSGNMEKLQIKFDKLTSHDITFVGIIQTARASGLEKFPIPYVLTNCHNSLCAVGGTINEDDHMFGLTCAKKYGGIYQEIG